MNTPHKWGQESNLVVLGLPTHYKQGIQLPLNLESTNTCAHREATMYSVNVIDWPLAWEAFLHPGRHAKSGTSAWLKPLLQDPTPRQYTSRPQEMA
jgi:hypothetical protein